MFGGGKGCGTDWARPHQGGRDKKSTPTEESDKTNRGIFPQSVDLWRLVAPKWGRRKRGSEERRVKDQCAKMNPLDAPKMPFCPPFDLFFGEERERREKKRRRSKIWRKGRLGGGSKGESKKTPTAGL